MRDLRISHFYEMEVYEILEGRRPMKVVIQRAARASVTVEGQIAGQIGRGLVILLGVAQEDTEEDLQKILKKTISLRIFDDDQGKTNLSLEEVDGEVLVVSQFTLLADCKKGRRPSFFKAGDPQKAEQMYETFIRECRKKVRKVQHGVFGAVMQVDLCNDGPFTILLASKDL